MFSQRLQLVCSLLVGSLIRFSRAQATSTATENGIITAAGGPNPTESISYSIIGAPAADPTSTYSTSQISTTKSSTGDLSPMGGEATGLADSTQHRLTTPAILGITLAVVLSIVAIIVMVIVMHKKRSQSVSRAKRKSIMDMEFAGEPITTLQRVDTTKSSNIGYFDVAKPLPAVVSPVESDRLSRSSTIIGDAAEVAQINRKASKHQRQQQKKSREAARERNHALQILITNEDNRTSVLPSSPLTSNPSTPIDSDMDSRADCRDNDGDPFAKRPSKI